MQSWGTQSQFRERDTGLEPSKSGVVGLLCAALGRRREEDVSDLAALRMGVRVDAPGTVAADYHTMGGNSPVIRKERVHGWSKNAVLSTRYYLADASFLIGLEGTRGILTLVDTALSRPRWALYLGRKSFVPSVPVRLPDGLVETDLASALHAHPPGRGTPPLRYVLEDAAGSEVRMDVPVSFAERRFAARRIRTDWR